ncbi:MAG: hypothetical protein KGJ01_00925 [Patescibacteria group bacterium]|nr:hypothetical protein [Patescibacteria group bacterium]
MSLLSWLGNAATSAGLDTLFLKLYENYSKNADVRTAVHVGAKSAYEKLTTGQARDRVWSFVLVDLPKVLPGGDTASKALIERQRLRQYVLPREYPPKTPLKGIPYKHGDEEALLRILTYIYNSCPKDKDKDGNIISVDSDKLSAILIVLGNMPDAEFDTVIEGFDNDRVRQLALRYWFEAATVTKSIYRRFNTAGERWRDSLIRNGRI